MDFKPKFCQRCGRPLDRDGQICSVCKKQAEQARAKRLSGYRTAYAKAKREALKQLAEAHPDQYQTLLQAELKKVNATSLEDFESSREAQARKGKSAAA